MQIRPIRTEEEYRVALARIDAIFDAEAGSPEFDELDVLATLVEAYERQNYPMDEPASILYDKADAPGSRR